MIPDLINGAFESCGALLVLLHCRRVWIDQDVKGVSIFATAVFMLWGFWNLYYYPSLDQWFSFYGGMALVGANAMWLLLMLWYHPEGPANARV